MAIFQTKYLTSTQSVFWNEDQSITGEVSASHTPSYNHVNLDDDDMVLTEEMEEELDKVQFPEYHTYESHDI